MPRLIGELLNLLVEVITRVFSEGSYQKKYPQLAPERFAALNALLQNRDELESLLKQKKKIFAIKLFRQETGASLKEAKMAVEQIKEELYREEHKVLLDNHQEQHAEIESLLRSGKKIDAIKLYRQNYGVGLKEAKQAVEALAVGNIPPQREKQLVDPDKLQHLLRTKQKILAIKYYRTCTGVSLKEAKEAVEWLEKEIKV